MDRIRFDERSEFFYPSRESKATFSSRREEKASTLLNSALYIITDKIKANYLI